MAIIPSGKNTVALTGADMFCYFISHFNMSSKDAITEMRANNQDLTWFDSMNEKQKDYVMSKRFLEEYNKLSEVV